MDRMGRRGNALIMILGISLLLGIQIYIVQSFTMTSFRHVESVKGHMRAIYVGESAFSRILARLKADRWENRWFRGIEARELNVPLTDGTYSSVVADVNPPIPNQKLVDVWIESRFDQSLNMMYYRVAYVDDTLDFTAQVYPRFFTFLESTDANPFSGPTSPAAALVGAMIKDQELNEAAAVAALEGVKGTCNLAGAGGSLGISFPPGQLVDQLAVLGGSNQDQCSIQRGITSALAGLPVPPLPLPVPPPPIPPPQAGGDVVGIIKAGIPGMTGPPYDPPAAYFEDQKKAKDGWNQGAGAHYGPPWPKGHELKDHLQIVMEMMVKKRDALPPADPIAIQIKTCADLAVGLLLSEAARFGGTSPPPNVGGTGSEYMNQYNWAVNYLYDNSGKEYSH